MATVHPPVLRLDGTVWRPADVVGGKGHGIDLMCRHGLPVPPAFCITTAVGAEFLDRPDRALDRVWDDVLAGLRGLERDTGRSFGHGPRPLLVSVRGGAARSMPGMLTTMLNVGITEQVRGALAASYGPEAADAALHANPITQLRDSITAVFASWNAPRALAYRRQHGLAERGGTAVLVQAMVFGDAAGGSGSGVLFSANPVSGSPDPFGEWLPGRPGTDLASGIADGQPLSVLARDQPAVYRQLVSAARKLEDITGGAVEIEFTVQSGRLWLLQSRTAIRKDPGAAPPGTAAPVLAVGTPACPGIAAGRGYADVDAALVAAARGEDVILVRPTTSPDDVAGMFAARGVVTEIGGATSHAAVLSREIGRPTVVGCGPGVIERLTGRLIVVDGAAGEVRAGG